MKLRQLVFCLAANMASWPALSAMDITDIQTHGFISQNYIQTQSNNFFGQSQGDGSFAYRELGINGSARLDKRTLAAVQLTSRHAGQSDNGSVEVGYALVDFQLNSSSDYRSGIRAGRIKIPLGLFNETRSVPMTRLGILLPQSIYFERSRNVAVSADGAEIYLSKHLARGDLSFRLLSVEPNLVDKATETNLLGEEQAGQLENKRSYAFRMLYEHNSGELLLALSHVQLNIDYRAASSIDIPSNGRVSFQPTILSAQYGSEFWTLTAEYALRQFKLAGFNSLLNDFSGESFYYQVSRHYQQKWEFFARRDHLYADKKDRYGKRFAQSTGKAAHSRYAKDWTLGLNYRASSLLSFKLQHHWINGSAWLPPADNPDTQNINRRWQLLAVSATLHY